MRRLILPALFLASVSYSQWSTDPANNLIVGYGQDPHICSDGAGGCYITYMPEITPPYTIRVVRLNRFGYDAWGSFRTISGTDSLPSSTAARITEDGNGGVIIGYLAQRPGFPQPVLASRLKVQRVDSAGNFLWGVTGVRVSLSETDQNQHAIAADGTGACIVAWKDTLDAVRAQRIDALGARVWGDSGIAVASSQYDILLTRTSLATYLITTGTTLKKLSSDGFSLWEVQVPFRPRRLAAHDIDNAVVTGFTFSTGGNIAHVAQSYDSFGSTRWASPYFVLGDSAVSRFVGYPFTVHENRMIAFAWDKSESALTEIYTQILQPNGTNVFPPGGLKGSRFASNKSLIGVILSDSISTIFVWGDSRSPGGIYAQRLDTLGQALWDSNDVPLNFPEFVEMKVTTDKSGGCLGVGFHQFDFSIRALQVNKYGQLGQVITSAIDEVIHIIPDRPLLYQNYPNPFNPQTTIRFELPRTTPIILTLHNILGQSIRTLASGIQRAGIHTVVLEADDLPSGTYLYQLTTPEAVLTHKLLIIK